MCHSETLMQDSASGDVGSVYESEIGVMVVFGQLQKSSDFWASLRWDLRNKLNRMFLFFTVNACCRNLPKEKSFSLLWNKPLEFLFFLVYF